MPANLILKHLSENRLVEKMLQSFYNTKVLVYTSTRIVHSVNTYIYKLRAKAPPNLYVEELAPSQTVRLWLYFGDWAFSRGDSVGMGLFGWP